MKKEYFNEEAYNYIESKINQTKINSVFKPMVIDIILRCRHEFQLEDKFFHRSVDSFINNVKDIYLEKLPERSGGRFYVIKKYIGINRDGFKENMNDEQYMGRLLEIISHECVHAMNYDETGNDRTFKRDSAVDIIERMVDMRGMFESFTEKIADRIICNRTIEDAFNYHKETIGYKSTTKFVDAIAAAFGIKEKELLSAYIKGKQELYEALNVNIKDEKFSKDLFKDIALNTRLAHNAIYKRERKERKNKKDDKDKIDKIDVINFANAAMMIYGNLEQILAYRVENIEWDNLKELQEKLEDIKLSQNAISNIMDSEKGVGDETLETLAMNRKQKVYAKVMCMEEIIKSQNENSMELISFVQHSESVDEILEFMRQNGIEINYENLDLMPEFEVSQKKRDEWVKEFCLDGEEWDNTEEISYMIANNEKIWKAKEKVSFIDRIEKSKGIGKILKPYIKVWKNLRKVFSNKDSKEEVLLLGERKRRKNRRQEILGFI